MAKKGQKLAAPTVDKKCAGKATKRAGKEKLVAPAVDPKAQPVKPRAMKKARVAARQYYDRLPCFFVVFIDATIIIDHMAGLAKALQHVSVRLASHCF
jgi:hypothetical protein